MLSDFKIHFYSWIGEKNIILEYFYISTRDLRGYFYIYYKTLKRLWFLEIPKTTLYFSF